MRPLRYIILTFVLTTACVFFVSSVYAAPSDPHGLKTTATAAGLSTDKSIPEITGQIIGAGLSLMGVLFLGLMLYGGFIWMIARGDSKRVDQAKDTITHAVIGLAIIIGAYAITEFTINALTGGGAVSCEENCDLQWADNQEELGACYLECQGL